MKNKIRKKNGRLSKDDRRWLEARAAELLPGYDFNEWGLVPISAALMTVAAEAGREVFYGQAEKAVLSARVWAEFVAEVGEFVPRVTGRDRQWPLIAPDIADAAINARPQWAPKYAAVLAAVKHAIKVRGLRWTYRYGSNEPIGNGARISRPQSERKRGARSKKAKAKNSYFELLAKAETAKAA